MSLAILLLAIDMTIRKCSEQDWGHQADVLNKQTRRKELAELEESEDEYQEALTDVIPDEEERETQGDQNCAGRTVQQRIAHFLSNYLSTFGVFVFGVGSLILASLSIAEQAVCMHIYLNLNYYDDKVSNAAQIQQDLRSWTIVYETFKVLFFTIQLTFLLTGFSMRKDLFATLGITVTLSANLGVWCQTFLTNCNILAHSAYDPFRDVNLTDYPLQNETRECFNNTTPMNQTMNSNVRPMLFPLTLQFTLLATRMLLDLWHSSETNTGSLDNEGQQSINDERPAVGVDRQDGMITVNGQAGHIASGDMHWAK
ncbi:uncharacterized protein LOC106171656, partial [Lingula anatina]|uniref:Uncharacterized protein LOC106171656 n=1 Tax=Lingula anatina TaxID=7574 RepID=A0A1S3JB43_LINAN